MCRRTNCQPARVWAKIGLAIILASKFKTRKTNTFAIERRQFGIADDTHISADTFKVAAMSSLAERSDQAIRLDCEINRVRWNGWWSVGLILLIARVQVLARERPASCFDLYGLAGRLQ